MKIGDRIVDAAHPPYVIAELGVNHDGAVDRALAMVNAARDAGCDAVKLQLFEAERLLGCKAQLAAYQERSGAADPFTMLRQCELADCDMATVVDHARAVGLHAIVTVFSVDLVARAEALPFDAYKTASTDIIHRPLITALRATGKPLLLSTGAASMDEVAEAAAWLGGHPHLLLHCVSRYPTPDDDAALDGRVAMLEVSPQALGYSDHTTSVDTGALAVAGGACLLEKHLTLDASAPGPDHAASLEPSALAEYVRLAHRAWRMRGPIAKVVSESERDVRRVARQSVTTTRDLAAGHVLMQDDLTIKRPGTGLPPARLAAITGRTLVRAIDADMPLTEEHLV